MCLLAPTFYFNNNVANYRMEQSLLFITRVYNSEQDDALLLECFFVVGECFLCHMTSASLSHYREQYVGGADLPPVHSHRDSCQRTWTLFEHRHQHKSCCLSDCTVAQPELYGDCWTCCACWTLPLSSALCCWNVLYSQFQD